MTALIIILPIVPLLYIQISSLKWSLPQRELVSAHGFVDNNITIWDPTTLAAKAHLYGHENRILHMAISPDGGRVVTAAADETLRFWTCFKSSISSSKLKQKKIRDQENMSELEYQMLSFVL